MVDAALANTGIDTAREKGRSALVLSSDRSHLTGGRFDPAAMVDRLRASISDAVRDGFEGLCATGDMRWELGTDDNFDRLLEYEARLEQVFREQPLRGVCQYHRDMVPAKALEDALISHRSAYVDDRFNEDNLFYVPPELLLNPAYGTKYADWMCRQLLRVLDAERSRDDVLRDLERRVAERTAELAVANRHLKAFSYSVSHDLKAPLRHLMGFGNALLEDCGQQLDAHGRDLLGRMLGAAERMGSLIDGMLVLGRAVDSDMRRTRVDITALAREVTAEIRESEPNRTAELVIEEGLSALGDPVLLRAVFSNLLGNAWKFTSRRDVTRIHVGRRAGDGDAVFFVKDNGAGFDMRNASRLFAPFQRMHKQQDFAGTGIGLATVERIISRHGGRIWADSRPDAGATFFFSLPDASSTPTPPTAH